MNFMYYSVTYILSFVQILSRNISRSYLGGLQERCFVELQDSGMFHNPNLTAVESLFMPWIFRSVEEKINNCKRNEQVHLHLDA